MSDLDDDARDRLLSLWESLGSPESSELPADRLEAAGISQAEYALWRMELEDEKRHERDVLADAAAVDAINAERRRQGKEPLKPDFTREELDALELRILENELRTRRAHELQGQAEWLEDDEDAS